MECCQNQACGTPAWLKSSACCARAGAGVHEQAAYGGRVARSQRELQCVPQSDRTMDGSFFRRHRRRMSQSSCIQSTSTSTGGAVDLLAAAHAVLMYPPPPLLSIVVPLHSPNFCELRCLNIAWHRQRHARQHRQRYVSCARERVCVRVFLSLQGHLGG